jgi:hypothetical protein
MILINASIQKVTKERKSIVAIINPISGKPDSIIILLNYKSYPPAADSF